MCLLLLPVHSKSSVNFVSSIAFCRVCVRFVQRHQSHRWEVYGVDHQRQDLPRLGVQSQRQSHPLDGGTAHLKHSYCSFYSECQEEDQASQTPHRATCLKHCEAAGLYVAQCFAQYWLNTVLRFDSPAIQVQGSCSLLTTRYITDVQTCLSQL